MPLMLMARKALFYIRRHGEGCFSIFKGPWGVNIGTKQFIALECRPGWGGGGGCISSALFICGKEELQGME